MLCQHYKEALIEAAASSAQAQGELRAHLDACASCRAEFEREQTLFASIDAGLHVTANPEVPASLLPRVRARLDEAATPLTHWFQPWIFAAASVALAVTIFLIAPPHHTRPDSQAKQAPQIPVAVTPGISAPQQNSGASARIASSNVDRSQRGHHSTLLRPLASSQLEVLVPPDERDAFASFVAVLGERREVELALVTPGPQREDEPTSLAPLQINELEIRLLAGTESEQSDEAEQKQ
jgi:hypothetical protein